MSAPLEYDNNRSFQQYFIKNSNNEFRIIKKTFNENPSCYWRACALIDGVVFGALGSVARPDYKMEHPPMWGFYEFQRRIKKLKNLTYDIEYTIVNGSLCFEFNGKYEPNELFRGLKYNKFHTILKKYTKYSMDSFLILNNIL